MRHERHIQHYLQNQGAIESGRQDETREDRSVVRVESPSDGIGRKEWPGSRRTCKQNTQIPQFGGTFTWERIQHGSTIAREIRTLPAA